MVRILSGPARDEHERLSALRAHYLFESSFCTPGCGNEKGSVENLVGYVRRNALVPYTRSFPSLEALNEHLRAWCERERTRHREAWQLERAALTELPVHPFSPSVSRPVVANKVAMVSVDRVRYSVPVACASQTLRAESFVGRVEIYRGSDLVARPRAQLRARRDRARAGPLLRRLRAQAAGGALLRRAGQRRPCVHAGP